MNRPEVKDRADIFLKTKVVDKSTINQIDRQEFINKIQQNVATRSSLNNKTEKHQEYTERDKQTETTRKSILKPNIQYTDIILIIDISKTGRKLLFK